MGFLDHSTNNIIIDAVLTDYGRQLLSENNGQFKIEYFSLSDDEVDYGIIKKYGRTVGKEKITKNTPIFEAQTKGSSAIKYKMITLPTPGISVMPNIDLAANQLDAASGAINWANSRQGVYSWSGLAIRLTQQVGPNGVVNNPDGLTDSTFTVYVNSRFIRVSTGQEISREPISRVSAYAIEPNVNNREFSFSIASQNLTTETFTQYGIGNAIITPISVVGDQTGLRRDFKVKIIYNS